MTRLLFSSFFGFGLYILLHIGILLWFYLLWMDGSFFVTLVILLNANIDREAIASRRVINYVKILCFDHHDQRGSLEFGISSFSASQI